MSTSWKSAGWRSLKHKGYPKMVVRFGRDGVGKAKLLTDPKEYAANEMAAGRVPEKTLETLTKDAEAFWAELAAHPNTERKSK